MEGFVCVCVRSCFGVDGFLLGWLCVDKKPKKMTNCLHRIGVHFADYSGIIFFNEEIM